MAGGKVKVRPGEVLTLRFWINYAIILVVTLPVPLLAIQVDGEIVNRQAIYECYWGLMRGAFEPWYFTVVGIHLGLCFTVAYAVWWVVLRSVKKSAGEADG